MFKQFLNHISSNDLFQPDQKILLAVSGGLDSVVMLHLFKEAGFSVGVAHCNFQLRGSESNSDEAFVKQLCGRLEVPFYSIRFETDLYARQNGLSTQMAARELRYAWFDTLMQNHLYDVLATAHHLNDSIETTLLNLIHGTGVDGLSGIPGKRNHIVRPLLFATRAEIEHYAHEKKITWREDKSNLSDDYQRNFVRHHVVPKLKELNPSLESTLDRGQRKVKEELELLDHYMHQWCAAHVRPQGVNILLDKNGIVNAMLLWRVTKDFGFNFDQCEDAVRELNEQPGKRFLSSTHQMTIDREHVIVSPHQDFWKEVTIPKELDHAILGSWNMTIETSGSIEFSNDSLVANLDADKIRFPLQWRKWKQGDFFYPLGMDHKRKLSDFLIDNKVSLADKNVVTVLESGGEIVWVVGYRIDNRYKITPQTRSVLSFSITPYFV